MKIRIQQPTWFIWLWCNAVFLAGLNHDLHRYGLPTSLVWNDNGWIFFIPIIASLFFSDFRRAIWMNKKVVLFLTVTLGLLACDIFLTSPTSPTNPYTLRWLVFILTPVAIWPIIQKQPRLLALALLSVLAWQAQWAIAQFVLQHDIGLGFLGEVHVTAQVDGVAKFLAMGTKLVRAYGPYQHANILGGSMVMALVLALSMRRFIRPDIPIWWLSVCWCMWLALLLSFSRLAWIGFLIWLTFTAIRRFMSPANSAPGVTRLVLPAIILFILLCPLLVFRSFDPQSMALSDRAAGYHWAGSVLLGLPSWHGVGIGRYPSFLKAYLDIHGITYQPWDIDFVHNSVWLIWLEWGWLWGSIVIGICFYTWLRFWPKKFLSELLILLGTLLPMALFDHYLVTTTTPFILWELVNLILGRLYSQLDWQRGKERTE